MHIDIHVSQYSNDCLESIKSFFIIINQKDLNDLDLKDVKKHWMYTCMVNVSGFVYSDISYFSPYMGSKCKPTTPLQHLNKLFEVQITLVNYSGCPKWI